MGVEYALVCDKTKDAYELGKGPWADWRQAGPPKTLLGVIEFVETWVLRVKQWGGPSTNLTLEYAREVAGEIWSFLEKHPESRVVDDCSGDNFWRSNDAFLSDEERKTFDREVQEMGGKVYRQVGSRYRHA